MSQYGLNPLKELVTTYKLYKIFKKYNPKYSLHYTIKPNIFGGIAAYFANIKVINNIAGAGKAFANEDSIFAKIISLLYKIGLAHSSTVLFQNNDDMQLFLKNNLVSRKKVKRIPGSGVDLNKYSGKNNSDGNQFLFIGRLLKEKGIEYYLEAAKMTLDKFPNAIFKIVGEHENRKEYIDKDLLNKYLEDKNIIYYGSVSPDIMPTIIEESSCIVLPSYYREGVPRSLLESASMSKPIITTNSVGCKEVVDENINGYKCKIKDSLCLHLSMMKFLNLSKEEKRLMGQKGRDKMEKEFDENIVINTYINLIKD
jgi:glycosyltransferase involved in cell wall biosynthesis